MQKKKIWYQVDLYILPSLGTEHLYPLTLTGICQVLSYKKSYSVAHICNMQLHIFLG